MMQRDTQSGLDRFAAAAGESRGSVKDEDVGRVSRQAELIHGERQSALAMRDGEPATEKQLEFLKNLGMPIPQGLTKQAASRLIDEGKARRLAARLESY